jgi:nitrous oxidase accessory protein NosD
MSRTIVLLATMALTLLVASGLALVAGVGSATADSSVVGPGESIQKAVNAAEPGDTIVVRGLHREDVFIGKNGIKLLGQDAVIEAPPKSEADSRCSRLFGSPEGICVLGEVDIHNGKVTGPRVSDVTISGFTIRGFTKGPSIDLLGTRDATATKNRVLVGSGPIDVDLSVGNKIISNVVRDPVGGGINLQKDRDVTVAGNDVQGSDENAFSIKKGTDITVVGNDFTDNFNGMIVIKSTGTKILSNDVSRTDLVGIYVFGPKKQSNNAKIVGNHISGGPWGIFVEGAHGGSFTGNQIHDNCAGMFFEAFKDEPVGAFEVKGNTVTDNTRSCRGPKFGRKFSGIGIALLGASGMEVKANHISGNVPSGPTPISGGVVVSKDPYFRGTPFGGTQKPNNNSVIGNHFGRNKPDIFWDESGSGNRFVGNLCNTSVPTSLCN